MNDALRAFILPHLSPRAFYDIADARARAEYRRRRRCCRASAPPRYAHAAAAVDDDDDDDAMRAIDAAAARYFSRRCRRRTTPRAFCRRCLPLLLSPPRCCHAPFPFSPYDVD